MKTKAKAPPLFDYWLNQHNKKTNKSNPRGYLVVTAGVKKKRMTVYEHELFHKRDGEIMPSKIFRNFVQYISKKEEVKKILSCNEQYKKHLVVIEVEELSKDKTAEVPGWKFIRFGKYKKTNIDEIVIRDPLYAKNLIKQFFGWQLDGVEWRRDFNFFLSQYVLSDEFRVRVLEACHKVNEVLLTYQNETVSEAGMNIAKKLIGKPVDNRIIEDNNEEAVKVFITDGAGSEKEIYTITDQDDVAKILALGNKRTMCIYSVGQKLCFKVVNS